jgi:hypothetical protein
MYWIRVVFTVVVLWSVTACQSISSKADSWGNNPGKCGLSMSMLMANYEQPFVSERLAEKLGLLLIEEKYRDALSVRGPGVIVDKGDLWLATFEVTSTDDNFRRLVQGDMSGPMRFMISIRKTNGEIVKMTTAAATRSR